MTLRTLLLSTLFLAPALGWAAIADLTVPASAALATPAPAANGAAASVTTADGLQYTDLKVGSGPMPRQGQTVTVHYTGTFEDGRVFDSSRTRGTPFHFHIGLGEVIAGWDEGVATMQRGGHRVLHVPAALGYGARGAGDDIPPNTPLVFDIELLDIR